MVIEKKQEKTEDTLMHAAFLIWLDLYGLVLQFTIFICCAYLWRKNWQENMKSAYCVCLINKRKN